MSKPLGLGIVPVGKSLGIRIVRPTIVQDAIWDAVETAQNLGMSVEEFRQECAQAWDEGNRQKIKDDSKIWK